MTYCDLIHTEEEEEEVQATSRAVLTCPECGDRWEILLCTPHGHLMNKLTARGETLTCPCGATFPMLYNVMYGVV